jgi:chromosome transmission fidelity protein 1
MRTYRSHIAHADGAVMLAVVNGKLSEGVNFADGASRCVVVVGMPFADREDPVLVERMRFFDGLAAAGRASCDGKQFYVNSCMRAVNQAIGRSFRHARDFAAVVLLDERYEKHAKLLPEWVQRSYARAGEWGEVEESIAQFFARHSGG